MAALENLGVDAITLELTLSVRERVLMQIARFSGPSSALVIAVEDKKVVRTGYYTGPDGERTRGSVLRIDRETIEQWADIKALLSL